MRTFAPLADSGLFVTLAATGGLLACHGERRGLGCLRGRAHRVGSHVSDGRGLSSSSCRRDRSGRPHRLGRASGDKSPLDLTGGIEFTATVGTRPLDAVPCAIVIRSLSLEQREHSLGADPRPQRHKASIHVIECLRRSHAATLP